jgi:hypothetical protein
MTKEDLFTMIQKAGMVSVLITQEGDHEQIINYFDGPVDQFLVTAKAIGATAVFVQDSALEEWLFRYNPNEDDQEDEECDPENEIDLAAISPALAKYKKYLGQNYTFHLTAKGGAADLCLIVDQEWLADFENEIERAQGKALLAKPPPHGR